MDAPAAETVWRPKVPAPLGLLLAALQRGGSDPTQRSSDDGAWWRTAQTPEGPGTLRLATVDDGVQVQGWGDGAAWLVAGAPALLGANDDVTGFTPQHPLIEVVWRQQPYLRLNSVGLVFELIVPAVLEQRVTGVDARRSWRELLLRFGTPPPGPAPRGMRVMPPPAVWRRLPSWDWHRAGVDPGRARTIIAAAEVAGRLEESLSLGRDERLRRLRAVPGIGEWTAAEVAQRAWGDADAVSVGDFHLAALVGWALTGRPVDDAGMLEILAVYPGHRHRAARLVEISGARKPAFGARAPVADIRKL